MNKLVLLFLFVFTILSTGYLQEISSDLYQPPLNNDNTVSQIWSLQNYQGQRRRMKPCPRRSNRNNAEEQWIPSYSSRITHPLYENTVLQSQALKNEDFRESKPDPEIENEQLNSSDQRSSNVSPLDLKEEDCDPLEANSPLKVSGVEKTALNIIEDCLRKKQINGDASYNIGFGSSRRAMSDPQDSDPDDSYLSDNNNNYALDSIADRSHNTNSQNSLEDRNTNQLTTKLIDPEKGTGIARSHAKEKNLQNPRICYACSTATNPLCWEPDNRTTVKYCSKEKSCVTKTFGIKNSITMIRDCANTCEDSSVPGIEPKYKSCKLCHSDYCNAAISINSYNLVIILIIGFVKCTF